MPFIPARHHPLATAFYQAFGKAMTRFFFRSWTAENRVGEVPPSSAILLVGNHFSWWDGFWGLRLATDVLRRKFHVMMLEHTLQGSRVLRFTGAFSIKPGTREAIASLRYAADLLNTPGNLVLMYPQGQIASLYTPVITFSPGAARILGMATSPVQVVFYAAFVDYMGQPRPAVHVTLEAAPETVAPDADVSLEASLSAAYQAFYARCVLEQQQRARASHVA